MEITKSYFGILDYIVFALVLGVSSSIGIYYRFTGGKQKTLNEYMLADKSMPVLPVAFSLMASFMSAITLLGVSKENYMFGTQFIIINISYIISTPIVCYLYLPVFFRLQNTSVYEYLERRFGLLTRTCASLAFSLQMTLYMGIVLYAPALALSAVTGISLNWSVIMVGLVCTFYSALGGMKAVLMTDVFQSLLMFAAVFAVITRGVMDYGFGNILKIADEGSRLEFFNVSPDPRERHTIWSLGIGGCFTYCSLYGVNQAQVQRLLTLLPLYVMETMGMIPGLSGLFVSGIFSGSLSTVSSAVNSLAAVTVQDYILPFFPNCYKREKQAMKISKVLACLYGGICMAVAFLTQLLGSGVLQASLTVFGAVGGPLLALFTMGMLCKCANQKGAMCGLISGLVLTLWIGFGRPKPPLPFKPVSVEGCPALNTSLVLPNNISTETLKSIRNTTLIESLTEVSTNISDPSLWDTTIEPLDLDRENLTTLSSVHNITGVSSDESKSALQELYAVSYMWVAAIGFATTLLVGVAVSRASGGNDILDVDLYFTWVQPQGTNITTVNMCTEKSDLSCNMDIMPVSSSAKLNPEGEMTHL
ncbi:putative sodium-dependent multivitamin transporter [Panulirus ornatus]|uniref:putative sodium-dependent multivitamin transporter n=1 Tax=Panulirus ornatus TaxID=150431 RepID=UPI003A885DE2